VVATKSILRRDITYTNVSEELSASIFRVDVSLNDVSSSVSFWYTLFRQVSEDRYVLGKGNFFLKAF
jgi:hypothetical protein